MKTNLLSLTLITLFSSSVMANSEMSIKDIQTVEDVLDIRNKLIYKMTEILNSENLSEDKAKIIEKRIELLSNKPLPTQEQIDWRVENPLDFNSLKQKKDMLKRDLRFKIFQHYRNNRQLVG
jgi:Na+-transporting NADH:ubiquinone oxidoreductase subunit NqrC